MIIVRIWEGLGNQLFQYAYAKALQLSTKQTVKLDMEKIYDNLYSRGNIDRKIQLKNFNISLDEWCDKDKNNYKYMGRINHREKLYFFMAKCGIYPYKYIEEKNMGYHIWLNYIRGNAYIKGWFQNEKYFRKYREVLIKEFTPKKKIKIPVWLKDILASEDTVSIHIRRGDYRKLKLDLPLVYYYQAIRIFLEYNQNSVFLIFTDDMEWVKKNFSVEGQFYFVNDDKKLEDYEELFIMSKCKHNIISNSTFSWWGAWLNSNPKKKVVAPKLWNGRMGKNYGEHIIPEGWLRI